MSDGATIKFDETQSKTVFKNDKDKTFTKEQIAFAKSFPDVEIEILDDRMNVKSKLKGIVEPVAHKIARKFYKDLTAYE